MASSSSSLIKPVRPRSPHFPPHNAPRVWFISRGVSPIAIALAKQVLEHGDYVVAGVYPIEFEKRDGQSETFWSFLEEVKATERWRERLRVVGMDARALSQCQAAAAEAVEAFGRIDVLLCAAGEALIGSVEEMAQNKQTISLVDEIFEVNFFGNVNIIKTVLPIMRERNNGHIIVITGTTGHLGTPGLGIYCSSQWAIEGYCDSLAYEVAPFNIKVSIIQANIEVNVLTNRITSVPPMAEYLQEENPAPLARELFSGLLDKLERIEKPHATKALYSPSDDDQASNKSGSMTDISPDTAMHEPTIGDLLNSENVTSLYAPLPASILTSLIAETVHALTAIGGHDNPPARHIVGIEGVMAVKEKLKTTSEELEDFIEVSGMVNIES